MQDNNVLCSLHALALLVLGYDDASLTRCHQKYLAGGMRDLAVWHAPPPKSDLDRLHLPNLTLLVIHTNDTMLSQ